MSIGYDQLSRNAYQILGAPFFEAVGAVDVKDIAKPHHVATQTNSPTWTQLPSGLWVLDFDSAIPEYLQIAAAASVDLDFIAQAFSFVWWMNLDSIANSPMVFCRGSASTDGYYCQTTSNGEVDFRTHQAGAVQSSKTAAGASVTGTPALWGVSRNGSSIRILKNGIDVTLVVGNHTNPVTSNRKFLTCIYDGEVQNPLDGKLWNPRALLNHSMTEYEHRLVFEMERKWFNV